MQCDDRPVTFYLLNYHKFSFWKVVPCLWKSGTAWEKRTIKNYPIKSLQWLLFIVYHTELNLSDATGGNETKRKLICILENFHQHSGHCEIFYTALIQSTFHG